MKPNLKYVPTDKWIKKDTLTAKAEDGSCVSLITRGMVKYDRPDSFSVCCGVEYADNQEEPHDGKYGPPDLQRPLLFYAEEKLDLMKDGYVTDYKLNIQQSKKFTESMVKALEVMGYKVKLMKNNEVS